MMKFVFSFICVSLVLFPLTCASDSEDTVGGRRVYVAHEKQNWFSAQHICRSLGNELLEIHSQSENEEAHAVMKKHGISNAWTALNDLATAKQFTWANTGKKALNLFFGDSGNDEDEAKHCFTIAADKSVLNNWLVQACHNLFNYMCQEAGKAIINCLEGGCE